MFSVTFVHGVVQRRHVVVASSLLTPVDRAAGYALFGSRFFPIHAPYQSKGSPSAVCVCMLCFCLCDGFKHEPVKRRNAGGVVLTSAFDT